MNEGGSKSVNSRWTVRVYAPNRVGGRLAAAGPPEWVRRNWSNAPVAETIAENLPEYERPPLTEVVCGVLFQPLEKFIGPYLGLLWQQYRDEFPTAQEAPPIMPLVERVEGTASPEREASDNDLLQFLPRTWFVHKNNTGIIQLQRDRFLYNWRKVSPGDEYPRYHTVIRGFGDRYDQFLEFLNEHNLGAVKPLQYELTYINHIPEGQGWNSLEELGAVFPCFAWTRGGGRFLPPFDAVNLRGSFPLPDRQGRLHVSVRSAERGENRERILLVDLTARGMAGDASQEAMYAWFDRAHEWIVRGFTELTGAEVQQTHWGRRR